MRYLALDQATNTTGWAIFENKQLINYGIYKATGSSDIERDSAIKQWMAKLIQEQSIDIIGVEGIQSQDSSGGKAINNVVTFQALARLQGVLLVACYELNKEYIICPPATWRTYCNVTGKSRSDKKKAMQKIAFDLYNIQVSEDEADAIGIGMYMIK